MEDQPRAVELGEHWSDEFAQKLYEQRRHAKDLLQVERERICCAGSTLDQQLQALADQLAKDSEQASRRESELERRAAELEERAAELAQLEQKMDDRKSQWDELQIEAAKNHEALLAELRKQHEQLQARREELENLQQALDQRRAEWEQLRAEHDKEHAQWMQQRDAAVQELANAGRAPEGSAEWEDLQRRFEMAVQEVRELKTNNAELLEELVALRQSAEAPTSAAVAEADGMDWESQKKRILAQLDSDLAPKNPKQSKDRLTVEGAIRITDQVVAEKEQEIRELKELLADQSGSLGSVAVGAAAIHQVLEQDDLIREERENLQRLQEEWKAKLRQAEIDISLERAKLARERADMEERAHSYERSKSSSSDGGKDGAEQDKKSHRGRWRTRLGLSDGDD